eukprot:1504569-Prorocentrum_lima.AAC.1
MTSSLVGSEMCIRDSLLSIACLLPLHDELGDLQEGRLDGGTHDTSDAVSYTHLTLPTICSV